MLLRSSKINFLVFRSFVLCIIIMSFHGCAWGWMSTETKKVIKSHPLANEMIKFTGRIMYTQQNSHRIHESKDFPYVRNALAWSNSFYYGDCEENVSSVSIEYIRTNREFLVKNVFLRTIRSPWYNPFKYWSLPHSSYIALLEDIKKGGKYWIEVEPSTDKDDLADTLHTPKSKEYISIFQQIEKNGSALIHVYLLDDSLNPIDLSDDPDERKEQTKEFFEQLKKKNLYPQKFINNVSNKFISMEVDARLLLRLIRHLTGALPCLKIEIRNAYEEKEKIK